MSLGSEEDCLEFIPPFIINPVFDLRDRAVGVPISVTRTLNTSWNYTKAYSLQVWYTYRRLAKELIADVYFYQAAHRTATWSQDCFTFPRLFVYILVLRTEIYTNSHTQT